MNDPATGEVALAVVPMGGSLDDGPTRGKERAVLKAASRGSPEALEALVRMFWGDAHRIALAVVADRAAAEDVAQEALLATVKHLDDFDRRRPFRPWLYRITTNKALDYVRARERRAEFPLGEGVADGLGHVISPVDAVGDDRLEALRVLEPKERAAVVLRHLIGMSSEEIGQILGMKAVAVRSLIHRALQRVRAEHEGGNNE
jgi:RNA polymerase sigma-70 factor (ECF subfamily)